MPNAAERALERLRAKPQARIDLGALQSFAAKAPPGLLERIGQVLDVPGRAVRETVFGPEGATGRGGLEAAGVLDPNRPGLDLGDVAGFAAEVALDPLTFVSGIGGLTRGGQLAARAGQLERSIQAGRSYLRLEQGAERAARRTGILSDVAKLRETRGQLKALGVAPTLAKTAAEQARAGQRAALRFGLPFGPDFAQASLPGVVDVVARAGNRLVRLPVLKQTTGILRATFDPRLFRLRRSSELLEREPEVQALFQDFYGGTAARAMDAGELKRRLTRIREKLVQRSGLTPNEFDVQFRDLRETFGVPERLADLELDARRVYADRLALLDQRLFEEKTERIGSIRSGLITREMARQRALQGAAAGIRRARGSRRLADRIDQRAAEVASGLTDRLRRLERQPFTASELARHTARKGAEDARFNERLLQLGKWKDRAAEALRAAPLNSRGLGLYLHRQNQALLVRSIASGARGAGNVLRSQSVAYAERALSAEAKEFLRSTGQEEAFYAALSRGARQVSTKTKSQLKRAEETIEAFTSEADEFFTRQDSFPKGAHWYEFDPAKSFPQHWMNEETSIAAGKLFHALADRYAKTAHTPQETIPLADFLVAGPLHRWRGINLSKDPETVARRLKAAGYGAVGIPKAVAAQALKLHEKITSPEEVHKLIDAYDVAVSFWRTMVTVPIPAFHIRNLLSDSLLSWLDGGLDLKAMGQAIRATVKYTNRRGKLTIGDPEEMRRLTGLNVFRGQSASEALGSLGFGQKSPVANRLLERFPSMRRLAERTEGLARVMENFTRSWHFYSMKAAGMTDAQAAERVRKSLLDYSELTDVERQVFRRVFFFYQWPRKILPRLFESYFDRTNRAGFLTRTFSQPTQDREGPIPEYLRQGSPVPVGRTADGKRLFLVGSPSPYEEFRRIDPFSPEGGIGGALSQLGLEAGRNLAPPLKIPLELIAKKDLFTERPILERDRASQLLASIPGLRDFLGIQEETLPTGEKRLRGDPYALYAARNQPFSRIISTFVGQPAEILLGLEPEKTSRVGNLIRFLTGTRLEEIEKFEEIRALRDLIEREATRLERGGKLRRFERLIAREAGKTDPESQELLQLERILDQLAERQRASRGGSSVRTAQ